MREKEKLLVTSNFSFFHSVFYPFGKRSTIFTETEIVVCKLLQFGQFEIMSFGKGLMHLYCKMIACLVVVHFAIQGIIFQAFSL